ncbi:MAG: 50S ribosomal protein L21 [Candidatus Marinimicrobia bacterium]|nr:50S ribosomal protein L21 [Candidatus Neomarinimicrobiota bacterium]MDP6936560.1 50S ribosomal protein L21 [Candidatus Neomarinimicrobiota bacterium]
MYAVIEFAGKQFKIEEGSSLKVPHIDEKEGSKVTFDKVLFLDDGKKVTVGSPTVSGAKINGEIVSHGKDKKVVVFKFKRRKGYQRKNSHRQDYSIVKVNKLSAAKKAAPKKAKKEDADNKKPAPKKTAAKAKPAAKKAAPKKSAPKKTAAKKVETKEKE